MTTSSRTIFSPVERRTAKGRIFLGICLFLMLLLAGITCFPYFFTLTAGLKNSSEIFKPGLHLLPETPLWQNYAEAWRRLNMLGMFKNSFIIAIGGSIGRLLVSAMAAYSLSQLKPKGGTLIHTFFLISLTIPGIAYLIPLYTTLANLPILHISLINTFWGLWLPYSTSALYILVLKNSFDQIPSEIYDAASLDGASEWSLFLHFTLPLSQSILLVLALLAFIGIWGDFLLPLLILRDPTLQPVSVRLFELTRQFPVNLHMAGAFIAMIPPTIVAILLQRFMKGGLTF
jgi:multiple sugar transport system permease protein